MGSYQSCLQDKRCSYCGTLASLKVSDKHDDEGYFTCHRCGGFLCWTDEQERLREKSKANRLSSSSSSPSPLSMSTILSMNDNMPNIPLKRFHIVPFLETLPDEKIISEDELFKQYLQPYFTQRHGLSIKRGDRFQIDSTDFKVVAVFPSGGRLDTSTYIHAGLQPPSAIQLIRRIHILPTAASIEGISSNHDWFQSHLRSYFHDEPIHLMQGEMFLVDSIEFKVMACDPDSGIVDDSSHVFADGNPLIDLTRVHVLPIAETLPPNEYHNISEEEIFDRYLKPYLQGTNQYLRKGELFKVLNVSFKILECEPSTEGLVTQKTDIFASGEPITEAEAKRQQEEDDHQLALQMQRQESRNSLDGNNSSISNNNNPNHPVELLLRLEALLHTLPSNHPNRIIIQRLHDRLYALNNMPLDQQRLHTSLDSILRSAVTMSDHNQNGASKSEIETLPTYQYKKRARKQQQQQSVSVSSSNDNDIETKEDSESKNNNNNNEKEIEERFTCMVCLSDFEDNDILRTLPCLHRYHKDCIDQWLLRSKVCPLCKNAIS